MAFPTTEPILTVVVVDSPSTTAVTLATTPSPAELVNTVVATPLAMVALGADRVPAVV